MRRNVNLSLFLCAAGAAAHPVVAKASTILDGSGNVLENRNIVIEDGKISRITAGGIIAARRVVFVMKSRKVYKNVARTASK